MLNVLLANAALGALLGLRARAECLVILSIAALIEAIAIAIVCDFTFAPAAGACLALLIVVQASFAVGTLQTPIETALR